MPNEKSVPVIDLSENMDVHCKAYIQPSFDKAIKAFQMKQIEDTGRMVTYSEAVRRLIVGGLANHYGTVEFTGDQETDG